MMIIQNVLKKVKFNCLYILMNINKPKIDRQAKKVGLFCNARDENKNILHFTNSNYFHIT